MADDAPVEMKPTLGLTGLTMNAMALIAPGAFLWLTFYIQATTGVTAPAMWMGIFVALLLCLATAVCYAEMAKLYPGTGQFVLLRRTVVPQSRQGVALCAAFEVHRRLGLAPLLLDLSGRDGGRHGHPVRLPGRDALAELHERLQSRAGVHDGWSRSCSPSAWPTSPTAASTARRRSTSPSTSSRSRALAGVLGDGARLSHEPSAGNAWPTSSIPPRATLTPTSSPPQKQTVERQDDRRRSCATPTAFRKPKLDAAGKPVPFHDQLSREGRQGQLPDAIPSAGSVVGMHNFGWMFVQATVAILILVGFESVHLAWAARPRTPSATSPSR